MHACLRFALLLAAATMLALSATAAPNDAVTKPVTSVFLSVRTGKDLAALKHFSGEQQGRFLLGDEWTKGSEIQRKEFIELFHVLFAKIAFPKVRENLTNLASATYAPPEVTGADARVASTLIIDHPLKRQELKVDYILAKEKAGWKLVDVAVLGESMLVAVRDDNIRPLLQEGGWDAVLNAMREKNQELARVPLK